MITAMNDNTEARKKSLGVFPRVTEGGWGGERGGGGGLAQ